MNIALTRVIWDAVGMPAPRLRKRLPMPAGAWISVISMGLIVILEIRAFLMNPSQLSDMVEVAVAITFLIFLVRGHPLARQWAIFLSIVVFGQSTITILFITWPRFLSGGFMVLSVIVGLLPLLVIVGLVLRTSGEYFDLRCPSCGSYKVRAASFLYNKIRCLSCRQRWLLREDKSPVATFD